jgi:hypothetical protein
MLLSKIIYTIQELRSKFSQSDDNPLSDRQVLFILNYYRSFLIRQDMEKGRPLSPFIMQELTLDLEKADKVISPMDPAFKSGDKILRTTIDIPKPIEGHMHDYLTYVGRADFEDRWTQLDLQSLKSVAYTRHAGRFPRWFARENKIYVKFPPTCTLKKVLVRGVFEEPELVAKLAGKIAPFQGQEWDYPISNNMLSTIIRMLEESEFKFTFAIPKDHENDGSQQ